MPTTTMQVNVIGVVIKYVVFRLMSSALLYDSVTYALTFNGWPDTHNGAEELVFEHYFKNLLANWKDANLLDGLSDEQARLLGDDLKGLYKTLRNHPALMDRRLRVGGKTTPPVTPPALISGEGLFNMEKRQPFHIGRAQPVCPFSTEWKLLLRAKDMNDSEVEVYQPTDGSNSFQWFYTVSCNFEPLMEEDIGCPTCCRGVNNHRYASQCTPRKSSVAALVRRPTELIFDWDYIQVDTSCNCAITPKV